MWDYFFYHDSVSVEDMNAFEMSQIVLQNPKSLFYNRSYGVDMKQNFPMAFFNQIFIAYSIANAIAKRNSNVTDGSNGFQDRRIACSQNFISITDKQNGERDIQIYYFNYKNYQTPVNITMAVQ